MVEKTIGFESKFVNAELFKSIEFIGIANPAPKAVRWLQRQWILDIVVSGPTYRKTITSLNITDTKDKEVYDRNFV